MRRYQCSNPTCKNVRVVHSNKDTLLMKCCDGENPVQYKYNNNAEIVTANLPIEPEREVIVTVPAKQVAPGLMSQKQNVAPTMNTRPVSAAPAVVETPAIVKAATAPNPVTTTPQPVAKPAVVTAPTETK